MLVRTDDEVYRVDAVWLGPPRATFPWRARYVSYGLGLAVMVVIMFVQRRLGISLDFFSVAWSLLLTVVITRFLGKRINYDRPLGQIVALFRHEVTGPRPRTAMRGGTVRTGRVRVRSSAPRSTRRRPSRAASVSMTKTRTRTGRSAPRPKKTAPRLTARTRPATTNGATTNGATTNGATTNGAAPVRTVADHVNGSRMNASHRVNGSRGGPA